MNEMIETTQVLNQVIAIHPRLVERRWGESASASRKDEFERLVLSSGCQLMQSDVVNVRRALPATLLGSGQAKDIAHWVEVHEVKVVFVDHQLTPIQQRNLEKAFDAKVVDRTGLILEIFGSRAKTREGVMQVELASLNYQISRLVKSWTHLERQRGGHGFLGGPGERQLELDRRMIRDKIKSVEQDLAKVRQMRATQREGRKRRDVLTVALVGYTNAGKSTLFNYITKAEAYVADQLFATLDPTLRQIKLKNSVTLMLSDTVGFVQELPHELVDAFRATLEEVIEADLILHVCDIADPESPTHKAVVMSTLKELGLDGDHAPPIIEVMNKMDLAPQVQTTIRDDIDGSRIALSAHTGQGVNDLLDVLGKWSELNMLELDLKLPIADGKTLAWCHAHAYVMHQEADASFLLLKVRISPKFQSYVQDWVVA
ncbi:MAG: GTPase HflX [Ghiorsea sp.]